MNWRSHTTQSPSKKKKRNGSTTRTRAQSHRKPLRGRRQNPAPWWGGEKKILKGPVWKKQSKDTDELLSMNEWPENPKTETIQGDTQNLKWCFCSQLAFPPAQYSSVQLKSQLLRSTRVASCITHQPALPKSLSCIKRWTRKQHEGFSPFWLWRWKHAQPETTAAPHLATANVLQLLQAFSRYLPPNHQAVPLSHLLVLFADVSLPLFPTTHYSPLFS